MSDVGHSGFAQPPRFGVIADCKNRHGLFSKCLTKVLMFTFDRLEGAMMG